MYDNCITTSVITILHSGPDLGGCKFEKNKHFLQVFGEDKEVRLGWVYK
jgi:hypothetical protein